MPATSGSPSSRSTLGMPPRAATRVALPLWRRNRSVVCEAAAARTRGRSASDCSVPDSTSLRRHRERQADVHVAAADECRRLRLLEDDARDAEEDRHHGDADAEAGREHGTPHRDARSAIAARACRSSGALAFDLSVAHRQDACGTVGERGVVRDDDECRAALVDAVEERRDLRAGGLIELAGRLVGEQQARTVGQRARDGHALHLSARQLRGSMVGARREADVFEQFARALSAAPSFGTPASDIGSSTFSRAVSIGSRKKR